MFENQILIYLQWIIQIHSILCETFSNLKVKMGIVTSSNNSQEAEITKQKSTFLGEVSELCVFWYD